MTLEEQLSEMLGVGADALVSAVTELKRVADDRPALEDMIKTLEARRDALKEALEDLSDVADQSRIDLRETVDTALTPAHGVKAGVLRVVSNLGIAVEVAEAVIDAD